MIKNKNYRRIVLVLVLIISLFVSMMTVTYAWFVEVKRTKPMYFKVGQLEYYYKNQNINDTFIDDTIIVPGMDLIEKNQSVKIYNTSKISSELRILIDVSYTIGDKTYRHILGDQETENRLIYEMSKEGERVQWDYGDDGFWYYIYEDNTNIIPVPNQDNKMGEIDILDSLKLNGDYFGNFVSAKDIVIKFTFQAKQSSNVEWNEIEWKELGIVTQSIN